MKKLLMVAALASLSSPALASKARLAALGNADHLVDAQTAFVNPAHLALLGDYVTMEAGATTPSTTLTAGTTTYAQIAAGSPNAEGGFVQSHGDAKWGVYLGRKSAFTNGYRTLMGFTIQENPVELQYAVKGPINWGAALNYSSSDKKSTSRKQNAAGMRLGAATDMWEVGAVIGLGAKATGQGAGIVLTGDKNADGIYDTTDRVVLSADNDAEFKSTTGFQVSGAYKMDSMRVYGKYYQDGFEYTSATNSTVSGLKIEQSQAEVGVLDVAKIESGSWFYGVGYQMYTWKASGAASAFQDIKTTNSYLPFLAGIEYGMASWLDLRASITQNVLLGSEKLDDGTGAATDDANTVHNNTVVAAGFGVKMNKWVIDGSWTAASSATGAMNANSLLTNVALTYNF